MVKKIELDVFQEDFCLFFFYRKIYRFVGFKYHSLEENLNLLSFNDIDRIFINFNKKIDYKIFKISTFGFTSNHLVICKKKN